MLRSWRLSSAWRHAWLNRERWEVELRNIAVSSLKSWPAQDCAVSVTGARAAPGGVGSEGERPEATTAPVGSPGRRLPVTPLSQDCAPGRLQDRHECLLWSPIRGNSSGCAL